MRRFNRQSNLVASILQRSVWQRAEIFFSSVLDVPSKIEVTI